MNSKNCKTALGAIVLAFTAIALTAGPSFAADFYMCAGTTTKTMPDTGEVLTMWGFSLDDNSNLADGCPGPVTVPGPALDVGGDTTLNIHLRNDLPAGNEPISLVVAGLNTAMSPTWIEVPGPGPGSPTAVHSTSRPGGNTTARVRSFSTENFPGGSFTTYSWTGITPGTYMYHSGTHPQVQVRMGLYGLVTKSAGSGLAYSGVPFDVEHSLVYSEVYPDLNAAVAAGTYNADVYPHPSTLDYKPKYFLINGKPYSPGSSCISAAPHAGDRVLLRMANAGIRELAPMILESRWEVVAEGGNKYQFARDQYSVLLPPGSTKDVVFTPASEGIFSIIDRRLNLTNKNFSGGGMLAQLQVGSATDCTGPVTHTVNASPNPTAGAASVTLTATVDDSGTGGSNIAGAEYFVDILGAPGSGASMNPSDGTFNSVTEGVTASINVSGLTLSSHTLYVRGQDSAGFWGAAASTVLDVTSATQTDFVGPVTSGVSATPNPTAGATSVTLTATVNDSGTGNSNIAGAEYFVGLPDPGMGNGTPMFAFDSSFNTPTEVVTASFDPTTLGLGSHTLSVRGRDTLGNWGEAASTVLEVSAAPPTSEIYISFDSDTSVPGVGTVADEDIVSYNVATNTWSLVFDGSDVGVSGFDINAVHVVLNAGAIQSILMSFDAAGSVPGIAGTVGDSDIVEFTPTSLGSTTAGSFGMYFDGSDVGLTSGGEDIDGLQVLANGNLLISTTGGFSGSGGVNGSDEDVFLFTPTSLGATTSGSWALYFDGSDVGLDTSNDEDIDAVSFDESTGRLFFSTVGNYSAGGASGADEDISSFTGTSFGANTSGTFTLELDLSTIGISTGEDVDALSGVLSAGPDVQGPATSAVTATPNPTNGATSVTLTATVDDTTTGGSNIAGAEYFVGADPGLGSGTPMLASDSSFNSPTEGVTVSFNPITTLGLGSHTLNVRGRDTLGNWGAATSTVLQVTSAPPVGFSDNFNSGNLSAYGQIGGNWSVVAGSTVGEPGRGSVLRLTNNDDTILYAAAENFSGSYQVKAEIWNEDNDAAGVAFRVNTADADNFYSCAATADGGFQAGLWQHVNDLADTPTTLLNGVSWNYVRSRWYTVTITVDTTANTIRCQWVSTEAGVELDVTAADPNPGATGSVGIWLSSEDNFIGDLLEVSGLGPP